MTLQLRGSRPSFLLLDLRNLGKFTFAGAVAYRLQQQPVRIAVAAILLGTASALVLLYRGPTIQAGILKHNIADVSPPIAWRRLWWPRPPWPPRYPLASPAA